MAEDISSEENKEIPFNIHDLTLLEHIMIGGSEEVVIDGNKILVNSENLKELQKNKNALRIILTPVNVTKGKRTLEEVRQARMHGKIFTGFTNPLFEFEPQAAYVEKGMDPTLELGELDQNGQLITFGTYFSQNRQKIGLPVRKRRKKFLLKMHLRS